MIPLMSLYLTSKTLHIDVITIFFNFSQKRITCSLSWLKSIELM